MATALAKKHDTKGFKFGSNGLLTTAEYMAIPDDGNRYELVHGELLKSPPALYGHGAVLACVVGKLQKFVSARKLGWVGVGTDVVMGKNLVLRPDINYVSRRRGSIIRGHIYGAPDLVVEITSPSNWQMDVFAKRLEYERFGIREYWALDIIQQDYKVYQWFLKAKRYAGGLVQDAVISSRVLNGFTLKLEDVWEAAQLE